MNPLEERLRRRIASEGPISVADYMAEANAHYYATRDPFGAAGDFTTAPEISQMFGELVGIWLADLWQRAGRPEGAHYVELGPGRGTLAADALRAMRGAGLDAAGRSGRDQPGAARGAGASGSRRCWHDDLATLPDGRAAARRRQRIFRCAAGARNSMPRGRELHASTGRAAASCRDGEVETETSPGLARHRRRARPPASPRRAARR